MVKTDVLLRWIAIAILFLLPFSIKKYVLSLSTLVYSPEFFQFFIYGVECLIFVLFIFLCIKKRDLIQPIIHEGWLFIVFFGLCLISLFVSEYKNVNLVWNLHIAFAVMFLISISSLVRGRILLVRDVWKTIGVSMIVQAEIAILQFVNQGSVGLRVLGEEMISVVMNNMARIDIFGISFLRSYGTLPHPNILGVALAIGFFAWLYLFSTPSKQNGIAHRGVSLIALFVVFLGLITSFSRGVWGIVAIFCFTIFWFLFFNKDTKHAARELLLFLLVVGTVVFGMLGWAIIPRSESIYLGDRAVEERVVYNSIAKTLIAQYPFGVGLGNSVLRAEEDGLYVAHGLQNQTTHQPTHNVFLLLIEEIGFLGFITFLFSVCKLFFDRRHNLFNIEYFFVGSAILILLLTGFFDHYIITSNFGRLMFFGFLGIMLGLPQAKSPRS